MAATLFPFKYYAVLPESSLTTAIRQKSWDIDKLFPLIKTSKSELKRIRKGIKSGISDAPKLQSAIASLAAEIRTGIKDLKLINFYDSAIFYLYFKLLRHVLELCEKEEAKLMQKTKEALSKEEKLDYKKLEGVRKAKDEIEESIKDYEKAIGGLKVEENELSKVYQRLVKKLGKLRWGAEKQAQEEFSFSKYTFRSMENLNRKIKVEAIKVKALMPQKAFLIKSVQRQANPQDVAQLAELTSEAIKRTGKDVAYSSKLISKFEKETAKLGKSVESIKKELNDKNKISGEMAKNAIKPWDDALKYLKEEVHKDLMGIFRNIFVEYKHIGTRKLAA